jgi:RNA polymerase sigma-B factor
LSALTTWTPARSASTDVTDLRRPRGDAYEHLAPMFEERARLPADHPRRELLRDQLITAHLPVARRIARKFAYRGDNSGEDVEQVATLGLIHAVDRFEPERGVSFLSFAVPTMTGEVLRYFRDHHRTVRVPRPLRDRSGAVERATAELSQQLGRAPRPSEIAAHLDLDLAIVLDVLQVQYSAHCESLDEPARDPAAENRRFDRALAHTDPEPTLIEFRESLKSLFEALPDRERRILVLRFFEGRTQTEIAARVGISQMHVSRLLAATLARLRAQLTGDEQP